MILTPAEVSYGIDALCDAAKLDLSYYSDDISRAVFEYDAPAHVKNVFLAAISDPSAQTTTPERIHHALSIFMNRFMAAYGLRVMDKKLLVREKWRQMLVSTLLGEADVELIEGKGMSIRGKPGTAGNKKFQVRYYGLRRRLYVHEDFMLPRITDQRAKLGMSRKYIANFGYCYEQMPEQAADFYNSIEAAVTLAGAHFDIVDIALEENSEFMPEHLDEFIEAITAAVRKGRGNMTEREEGASNRLHGLLTKSSSRLMETLGMKVEMQYKMIFELQKELRAREQGGAVDWKRR